MTDAFFSPFDAAEFDRRQAAHLLRRAGFAPSPAELDAAVEQGLEATVEGLFADHHEEEAAFQQTFEAVAGSLVDFADPSQVQGWWIHRMLRTVVPLREKLTLFWHGHFATSVHKVEDAELMHRQIETLRGHAWGNFRDLVLAVARDTAMLIWLDGESSTAEHPNENFARELMELFTCGIGNYTERDVLEAARAFTGWHRDGERFVFAAEAHDGGRKQFLGRSGRFDGGDIIDLLVQHPATPRFIAAKLLRFFATPQPTAEAVSAAGELLDHTRLDIKWFLRELFQSSYFHSEVCRRRRVSSPAELVVGTVRALGARVPAVELAGHMAAMGQELLAPPNVKGWDGDQAWINSSTWPARLSFAQYLVSLEGESAHAPHLPLAAIVPPDANKPRQVIERLAEALMQGELASDVHSELAEFLVTTDEGRNDEPFRDDEDFRTDKTRQALAMILSLPEYQAW
ncbi:MAG TPA: DUF1800 domain-containing protein [Pirellulales bacterium]|jgi:uncharacterized protein (DUF1800 family)|nr:DUF1800 domain-containing protein [Pirellulales bacterium]